jgi:hypothetical protein
MVQDLKQKPNPENMRHIEPGMAVQSDAVVHVGGIVLPVMAQPGMLTPVSVTQE